MKKNSPKISIIIRTKNEEQWINHSLQAVYNQTVKNVEVIIVDNESTDNTLKIARRYPVKIVQIKKYLPGDSLNQGIEASTGEYIVCLSAHCIPKDERWLESMLANFSLPNLKVAGVYGRQIPFSYSSAVDKRDLLITFGLDKRIQHKDTFFHNANSMFLKKIWEKTPFDANVTNIEDRVWAQEIIKQGYQLVYEPLAEVFHCHGIHHGNENKRCAQTVKILENLNEDFKGDIPQSLKPEKLNVVAFLPMIGEIEHINKTNLLLRTLDQLQKSSYIKDKVVISENDKVLAFAAKHGCKTIKRGKEHLAKGKSVEDSVSFALNSYEKKYGIIDAALYVNYLFPFRPENFFDNLISQFTYSGVQSAIAALKNFRVFWLNDGEGYKVIADDLKPKNEKTPMYEGLIGLGCVTASHIVRKGDLLGEEVELLTISDEKYAIKIDNDYSREVAKFLIDQEKNK